MFIWWTIWSRCGDGDHDDYHEDDGHIGHAGYYDVDDGHVCHDDGRYDGQDCVGVLYKSSKVAEMASK